MDTTTRAYPLTWPTNKPRSKLREFSHFKTSFNNARMACVYEIERLGGTDIIISTNLPLRADGAPYSRRGHLEDSGVAVYFTYHKEAKCFACDRWHYVEDNMQAIAKTIEALRGIVRWATGDMLRAAFTGYAALPAPAGVRPWRDVFQFGMRYIPDIAEVTKRYRQQRSQHHPDNQGDPARFDECEKAYTAAKAELLP